MQKGRYKDFEDREERVARSVVNRFLATHPELRRWYDKEDLVQECLIHWFQHRDTYDPEGGASLETYMAKVLKRKLRDIADFAHADMREGDLQAVSLDEPVGDDDPGSTRGDLLRDPTLKDEADVFVALDVDLVLEGLTLDQQRLYEGRLAGKTFDKLSEETGKPKSTLQDDLKRIRRIFQDKGLLPDDFSDDESVNL